MRERRGSDKSGDNCHGHGFHVLHPAEGGKLHGYFSGLDVASAAARSMVFRIGSSPLAS
jgi:hypothetical protein